MEKDQDTEMMTSRILLFLTLFILAASGGCASSPSEDAAGVPMPDAGPRAPVPKDRARLYIFNISRWARVPTNLLIDDNGRTLVNLPWNSYKVVTIRPGVHEIRFSGKDTPTLFLTALGGATYYMVVGYNPRDDWPLQTWQFPVGDRLFILKRIPARDAYPLEGRLIPR